MPHLSGVNLCNYNGVVFDERFEILSASAKNIYDTAGRTVIAVNHSMTIRTIITTSSTNLDTSLADIRRRLLSPGKPFSLVGTGYGVYQINISNLIKDVLWGPKPQEVSYRALGVNAAEIVWKVDFAVPECSAATYSRAIMEFNYTLAFDIDRQGFTTRTYSGFYRIAMTRQLSGIRTLDDSADNYWQDVIPELAVGFRREVQNRQLDETKAKMTFTIVDTEMPDNILPIGVTDCKASHSLESTDRGLVSWIGTLNAQYEIARDFSAPKTYEHFIKLCQQRVRESLRNLAPLQANVPRNTNLDSNRVNGFILPTKFSMEQPDIYGKPSSRFSFQYLMVQPWFNILRASAMWLPVDNDWNEWAISLKDSALNPRGNAKMKFKPNEDAIIDLCLNRKAVFLATQSTLAPTLRTLVGQDVQTDCPSLTNSWLFYDVRFETESQDRMMIHKPLPQPTPPNVFVPGLGAGFSPLVNAPDDIVQRITSNSDVIYCTGSALRICYDIVQPRLVKIGTRDVELANRKDIEYFRSWVIGDYGHTLVAAMWRQRYVVPAKRQQPSLSSVSVRTLGTPTNPREAPQNTGFPVTAVRLTTDDALSY